MFYANGPGNGICDIQGCDVDAWTINFGYSTTNSIGAGGSVGGFTFATWMYPGDTLTSVDWSLGTQAFGSDLGSGTASVNDEILFTNSYGYVIHQMVATGMGVAVSSGNWLTLQNATTPSGNPVYWDENAGPSLAYQNSVGSIPSESFNVSAGGNSCMPEQVGTFHVIHDFSGTGDGSSPFGVTIDPAGHLYGPTNPYGTGSIYKLWQAGSGWILNTLYNFTGGNNGTTADGVMVGPHGILYGGTNGGLQNCPPESGRCGLIFDLKPSPTACLTSSCAWKENAVYNFTGLTDAWNGGGLVSDQAGNLYGVSGSGGSQQQGAVFQLTPSAGGWTENILYNFTGGADGKFPTAVIVGNDGHLYGMTSSGGANGDGGVFQLTSSGHGWTETVLYNFPFSYVGSNPHSLLQDSAGNLFGETWYTTCCDDFYGIVFMLTPSNGSWVYTELHHGDESDDEDYYDSLILDGAGNLYGTGGGSRNGCIDPIYHGYIFKIARVGWQYSTPVFFDYTSFDTTGDIAIDAQGNIYGTTYDCGSHSNGTVWEFTPTD